LPLLRAQAFPEIAVCLDDMDIQRNMVDLDPLEGTRGPHSLMGGAELPDDMIPAASGSADLDLVPPADTPVEGAVARNRQRRLAPTRALCIQTFGGVNELPVHHLLCRALPAGIPVHMLLEKQFELAIELPGAEAAPRIAKHQAVIAEITMCAQPAFHRPGARPCQGRNGLSDTSVCRLEPCFVFLIPGMAVGDDLPQPLAGGHAAETILGLKHRVAEALAEQETLERPLRQGAEDEVFTAFALLLRDHDQLAVLAQPVQILDGEMLRRGIGQIKALHQVVVKPPP